MKKTPLTTTVGKANQLMSVELKSVNPPFRAHKRHTNMVETPLKMNETEAKDFLKKEPVNTYLIRQKISTETENQKLISKIIDKNEIKIQKLEASLQNPDKQSGWGTPAEISDEIARRTEWNQDAENFKSRPVIYEISNKRGVYYVEHINSEPPYDLPIISEKQINRIIENKALLDHGATKPIPPRPLSLESQRRVHAFGQRHHWFGTRTMEDGTIVNADGSIREKILDLELAPPTKSEIIIKGHFKDGKLRSTEEAKEFVSKQPVGNYTMRKSSREFTPDADGNREYVLIISTGEGQTPYKGKRFSFVGETEKVKDESGATTTFEKFVKDQRKRSATAVKESTANKAAGRGYITNAKVKEEKKVNEAAGRGKITNAEVRTQQAANEADGRGKITNAEVKAQRAANKKAGRGQVTDAEFISFNASMEKATEKLQNVTNNQIEITNLNKAFEKYLKTGKESDKGNLLTQLKKICTEGFVGNILFDKSIKEGLPDIL